jgi:hypothetical protein
MTCSKVAYGNQIRWDEINAYCRVLFGAVSTTMLWSPAVRRIPCSTQGVGRYFVVVGVKVDGWLVGM